jgi:hypothetical protein
MRLRTPLSGGNAPPVRRTSQTPSSSATAEVVTGLRGSETSGGAPNGLCEALPRPPDRPVALAQLEGRRAAAAQGVADDDEAADVLQLALHVGVHAESFAAADEIRL